MSVDYENPGTLIMQLKSLQTVLALFWLFLLRHLTDLVRATDYIVLSGVELVSISEEAVMSHEERFPLQGYYLFQN